jgi:RND family efflux transporter MFP subunit
MKTKIQNTIEYIKNHKKRSALVLLVLAFVGYKVFSPSNSKTDQYIVKRSDVVQKVIVNGNTKAVRDSSLAFEVNGTVRTTYVDVGTRVTVGQPLVGLDQSTLYADLLKAQANVASEQARLDELKNGARPEDIAVSETEVSNAKITLEDAERNLQNKVVDVVNNSIDQFFSNPKTNSPQFNLAVNDTQLKNNINNGRFLVEAVIQNWTSADIDKNLPQVIALLDNVALAVNSQSQSGGFSQTTLDTYRSSISTARSTLTTARETLNTSRSKLALAEKNLSLKKSGSTPEAIKAQEAKVLQNQAQVESVQASLSKMTLRSPQAGIVTKQDAKVGEIVTPGKVVVSVISDNDLEIESNVSEVSIGKVAVGNPVLITFDAFPGETFSGKVSYIEPGETIVDGVVNYKVTVAFNEKYLQIKSGLTSRLEIITSEKKDVLSIPEYAITKKEEASFVTKINGKVTTEVPVTLGLRGQDGFVEVLSGLVEGEIIETVAQTK